MKCRAESKLRANETNYVSTYHDASRKLSWNSWWYSLLTHLHLPCPKHGDQKHVPPHCRSHYSSHSHSHSNKHHSGGGGGSSNGGGGGSDDEGFDNGTDDYNWGDDGYMKNDEQQPVRDDDNWGDDGYGTYPIQDDYKLSDDGWNGNSGDGSGGWEESKLDNRQGMADTQAKNETVPAWPFLVGAVVAGVIGAVFIASRVSEYVAL